MNAQPNFGAARQVMAIDWSVPQLETYICSHGPGLERAALHIALDLQTTPAWEYVTCLVVVAVRLFEAGHLLSPLLVLQEYGFLPLWWGQVLPDVQVQPPIYCTIAHRSSVCQLLVRIAQRSLGTHEQLKPYYMGYMVLFCCSPT